MEDAPGRGLMVAANGGRPEPGEFARQKSGLPTTGQVNNKSTALSRLISTPPEGEFESLRNLQIREVPFRAGPHPQGHRPLRIAEFHIVDDQARLHCPVDV